MTPQFKHDCPKCRYVWTTFGVADYNQCQYTDWYVCEGADPSVIGRHRSDGPEYWSVPRDVVAKDEYLVAAHKSIHVVPTMMILARAALQRYESEHIKETP